MQMARALLTTLGVPSLRVIEVAHPLGGLLESEVRSRAESAAQSVLELLDSGIEGSA